MRWNTEIEQHTADGKKSLIGKQGCKHGENASAHRNSLAVQIDKSQTASTYRRRSDGRSKLTKYIDAKTLRYRQLALAEMSEAKGEHQILDGKEQYSQTYPQKKTRR